MLLESVRTIPLSDYTNLVEAYSFVKLENDDFRALIESISRTTNYPDFINQRKRKVQIIIGVNPFEIHLKEDETAIATNIIFIDYEKYKNQGLGNKILIFTEELVHHFWDTDDEPTVKPIVIKILDKILPELTYDTNLGYKQKDKPIGLV